MARIFAALLLLCTAVVSHAQTPVRVTLMTPAHYQVFQRHGSTGTIHISGIIEPDGDYTVTADLGAGGTLILASHVASTFDAYMDAPQGQYTLTIHVDGTQTVVNYVGVGDVFIIAGQSNAMGMGLNRQTYSHPTLKASLFANSYQWTELRDPTDSYAGSLDPISVDTLAAGSVWPLVATHIMADQNVPVAFIPTAKAGSSIVRWLPDAVNRYRRDTLFGAMVNRAAWVGDVRAILWWQGEIDALNRMHGGQYAYYLNQIADAAYEATGGVLIPAYLEHMRNTDYRNVWQIIQGTRQAVADNPNILPGAELTDLRTQDAYHLQTDAQLAQAAERWWHALQDALYS